MQKQLTRDEVLEIASTLLRCDKRRLRVQPRYFEGRGTIAQNDDQGYGFKMCPRRDNVLYFADNVQIITRNTNCTFGTSMFHELYNYVMHSVDNPTSIGKLSEHNMSFYPQLDLTFYLNNQVGNGDYFAKFYYLEISLI